LAPHRRAANTILTPGTNGRRRRKAASASWFGKDRRLAASNGAVLPVKQREIRLDSREFARMFTRT
jgi:hypothetical protein